MLISCPKCAGIKAVVIFDPGKLLQCLSCQIEWDVNNRMNWRDVGPLATVFTGSGMQPWQSIDPGDTVQAAPTDFRVYANDLSPKDRQALYEYLYNAHGCRIR